MAERISGTLTGDVVATATLTVQADSEVDYTDVSGNTSTKTIRNRASGVTVTNIGGQGAIYFTVDGSTPTVAGEGCYVAASRIGTKASAPGVIEDSVAVKLISSAAADYLVEFKGGSQPTSIEGAVSGDGVSSIVSITQAEYDALDPKDGTTAYLVTGA